MQVRARLRAGAFELDVAFEAGAGVTVLFGPSGAGKTTTLAVIAGLRRPDAGRVVVGDERWFDSELRVDVPAHRRRVAYLFQAVALFPHMTAVDNVAYGIDPSLSRRQRRLEAEAALARMKVGHLADRRPATLSGGEAQRVALARALARRPRVVLLDEPFSALDLELRRELRAEVVALIDELAVPALVITHDADEALALGRRAVRLERGSVAAEGDARQVLARPAG